MGARGYFERLRDDAKELDEAHIKANELSRAGVAVLRIERQIMTTTTSTICEF